jgi:tryptophanyl-tRNA synthetase
MKTLCGFRPTGQLHIGHYFSVIEPSINGADVLIAEYHAPEVTDRDINDICVLLKKYGVTNIILQRNIFNPLLYFRMLNLASIGELNRMTQYRSNNNPTPHLFCYPVLMACDIVNYDAVIVGEDQIQHLNFSNDLLTRYNKHYNENIHIPIAKPVGGRILSFTDPKKKMSKNEPNGCLFLTDNADTIAYKIKRAVTTEEGRKNLLTLYHKLGGTDEPEMNSILKIALTEKLINLLVK